MGSRMRKDKEHLEHDGETIQSQFQKRCNGAIVTVIVIGILLLVISLVVGICCHGLTDVLRPYKSLLKDYKDFAVAVHTVLGAVAVYYYSVKDNRKEGIPHRTIMAYSFGSLAIPLLFASLTIMVMYVILVIHMRWYIIAILGLVYTLCIQAMCIGLILFSTSYHYTLHVICNAEIRQFRYMCRSGEDMKSTIKVYMMRHMEQAIRSNDLMGDKMVLAQKILWTPLYCKEMPYLRKHKTDIRKLCECSPYWLYEYYYDNLLSVFLFLKDSGHHEERMKMYQLLYELIERLDDGYGMQNFDGFCHVMSSGFRESRYRKGFLTTVSAVINAVLYANTDESEAVCHHILNECMKQSGQRNTQTMLYFIYQELLFHTADKGAIKINNVDKLYRFEIDKEVDDTELTLYREIWYIWCRDTNLSEESKKRYLYDAFSTLEGKTVYSEPLRYIRINLKKAKAVFKHDDTFGRVDQ